MHVAATHNHVLTAHILVQAGAELNALDDSNETPLMVACKVVIGNLGAKVTFQVNCKM